MPGVPSSAAHASAWRTRTKEVGAFAVVGAVSFVIDLGLFQVLYAHAHVGAITAKALSTVVSMTVAYLAHRHWSFSHRERSGVGKEYLLFTIINGATLLLGLCVVALARYPLGQEGAIALQAANVLSIALGSVIRFLAYRRWVFPASVGPIAT